MVKQDRLTVEEANDLVSERTGGEVGVVQDRAEIVLVREGFNKRIVLVPNSDVKPAALRKVLEVWTTHWPT